MSTVPETAHVDFDTWLDLEAASDARHELVGGVLYLMVGSLRRHNLLVTNFSAQLYDHARAAGCRLYQHDMKLRAGADGYYPDVMLACGDPPDERFELAPCLLIEVLSPSTAVIDRREKLAAYTRLPSLRTYVIAEPDSPRLEVHRRHADERWTQVLLGAGDRLELPCPKGAELVVDDLYDGVQ